MKDLSIGDNLASQIAATEAAVGSFYFIEPRDYSSPIQAVTSF